MKKNAQYVGVDEKYIPEDEKYVDNTANSKVKEAINKGIDSTVKYASNKDNQQKIKKTLKKGVNVAKGIGIGYLTILGLIITTVIIVMILVISNFLKVNKQTNEINDNMNNAIKNNFNFEK